MRGSRLRALVSTLGLRSTLFDVRPTGEGFAFEVSLTNTGDRRGSEVVQVYVEAIDPAVQRPVRELKAFRKVELDPIIRARATKQAKQAAQAS